MPIRRAVRLTTAHGSASGPRRLSVDAVLAGGTDRASTSNASPNDPVCSVLRCGRVNAGGAA